MATKQRTYQQPSATSVDVSLSALLAVIRHTTETYPALCSGPLLGFEDDKGAIDITHAFLFAYPDQYEGGSLRSRNGAKYQQDVLESLKKLEYGVEFQGWFQSTITGNFVTSQLVDALVQQQLQNKNTFVLIHRLASAGRELDLKAYRLTESFVTTYLDGKWKSKDLESHRLSFLNIFEEIPLNVHSNALVNLYLTSSRAKENSALDYDIFSLSANQNVTSQMLDSLYTQIDSYSYDQTNFNYYQRLHQKELSKISQWKQQRKLQNMERAKAGESELDPNEWQSMFKLPTEPSRYNNLLHSHAIDVLADDLIKRCEEELTDASIIERKLVSETN